MAEAATLAKDRAERVAELKIAQERARMQAEAEQAAENLQKIQLANIHISALNLGARVELIQHGEPLRCKLAVIILPPLENIFLPTTLAARLRNSSANNYASAN